MGFAEFNLHYLRDKDGRNVDFLVVRNQEPWLMIEVKTSSKEGLSPHSPSFSSPT